jgi:hypothetical protein
MTMLPLISVSAPESSDNSVNRSDESTRGERS